MPTLGHLRGGNMPHPILITQLFSLNQKATENLMSLSPQVYQNTHLGRNWHPSDFRCSALTR